LRDYLRDLQLGTGTVQDNRVEAETVEEREREGEVVELVGEDGAADPAISDTLTPGLT